MKKRVVIALDGPAGSGKSTIARLVAKKVKILYVDSGAIYRAYTLQYLREGIKLEDQKALSAFLERLTINLENEETSTQVFVNGENVSREIRSSEVTASVSSISENTSIRDRVTRKLRIETEHNSVVMDGRDIGTVVFPDAELKIFLTASIDERARRRKNDLKSAGVETDLEKIKNDIQKRDKHDSERNLAPLQKPDAAILLDTTNLTIDECVDFIVKKAIGLEKSV